MARFLFSAVSPLTYKRRWDGINNAILSILQSGLVKMADREVQVPADQNLQAAQAEAVLNQPPPPPAQNPEEPPANPQNTAAEEVTLEVCLFFWFFVLTLFCFASTCCLYRRFSSFSPRVLMPCFVTYSFIITVLRTPLIYSQVYFLPLIYTAYFFCGQC